MPCLRFRRTALTLLCTLCSCTTLLAASLQAKHENTSGTISIYRQGEKAPILTQVAGADFRPYLHPIVAPDGKGELTEFSPGHHRHQTGLYWGFTRVNGRDHFHHPGDNYFKRKEIKVLNTTDNSVSWSVAYDLLDAAGKPVLTETKTWTMRDEDQHYVLDLVWSGEGRTDVTIGKYQYGGLFLRMPWKRGMEGFAVNNVGQKNREAEGKRADWVDAGMTVPGRDDMAHILIMDHPDNPGYPLPWRVDGQLGIGPCYARLGDWKIPAGKSVTFRHRILIYTGAQNDDLINHAWGEHIKGAKNKPKPPSKSAAAPVPPANDPNSLILQIVSQSKDPTAQAAMLNGMLLGLEGQRQVRPPAIWARLYPQLQKSPSADVRSVADKLAQKFGDQGAHQKALATLQDNSLPVQQRRDALAALLNQKRPELKALLPKLIDDPSLRPDAIRAYAVLEDPIAPKLLLQRYKSFDQQNQRIVVETLASRRTYAASLLQAIKSKVVSKSDVPVYLARTLRQMLGGSFTDVWGDVKEVAADKAKQMSRYKALLTDSHVAKGDISNGRVIFDKTCLACHTLFRTGGQVGPDITGSNRANLDYILYQLIDPNDDVPEAYRMVVVTTDDGLIISGRVVEEDEQRLILQTTTERKTILKNEIDERQLSPKSMMPEQMLAALKDNDVRDLILYLRSNKQVRLPE